MDLALAIAQGFHNAPRLYGDSTVRRPTRISGYRSGLRAAGEEFAFGIYDGVTGLVSQPYHGAKDGGAVGFLQGVGKGIGGFVLKDLAAIIGPVGYTMKGVHKELIKGKQPTAFIRKARILQGGKYVRALGEEEEKVVRERMDAAWLAIVEIKKEFDETKKEGLIGRVALARESRRLKKQGGFESVGKAQKALRKWEGERKGNYHDEKTHGNGHSPEADATGHADGIMENGVSSQTAARQERKARKEVNHARAVADDYQENVQAPPSTNGRSNINTATDKKLQSKGVVAEDFAPETPMPENTGPVDLEKHILTDGTSQEEIGTRTEHSRSLPTHGVTLGGV